MVVNTASRQGTCSVFLFREVATRKAMVRRAMARSSSTKATVRRMAMVVKAMAMRTIKSVPQISIKMRGNGEECTKGGGRSENIPFVIRTR